MAQVKEKMWKHEMCAICCMSKTNAKWKLIERPIVRAFGGVYTVYYLLEIERFSLRNDEQLNSVVQFFATIYTASTHGC